MVFADSNTPCLLQIVRRYSDFDLLNNSLQVNILKHHWHTLIARGILETGWNWQCQEQEISKFAWQRRGTHTSNR